MMRSIAGLLVILALVPVASSQNGTVCYGRMSFSKTACLTSSQTVNILGQTRPPTAVLMEIMGSGLPALPLISTYNSQAISFTSVIANRQVTTGQYQAEYLLIQDTVTSTIRTNKFQYGSVQISNFETRQRCQQVNFLTTMAGVPAIKLTPHTTAVEELIYLWLRDVTTTGFKICYHEGILFSGVHGFSVHYVAIAEQGQVESQRDIQIEHTSVRMMAGSQAPQGTPAFCQRMKFDLTYRSTPFVFATAHQDSAANTGEFISWVAAIDTTGATVCARNSEDNLSGLRTQNVTINVITVGGRMDIVPGMAQLLAVQNAPTVFCRDVTFPTNKFWTGLPMHVQLTVTWQKTPVITNGNHEASAVWAESVTHAGFKTCALVAGRHFADNYPIPAVNWLAYQLPASQCVTPPLIGGSCALPDWYTGARCCSVTVQKAIQLSSKILVSVRHTKTQTFIDAMTAWSELSECNGTTVIRLCARELQNFDGLHQGIILHWLLVETALPPFIPEHGDIGFPRQFYGLGTTMPAVCKDLTFVQNYNTLPIATVIMTPKNCTTCYTGCVGFSNNDFVTWIETRSNEKMRVCMKSLRACLYREDVKVSYIVVTEPRCAGKSTGFYLKDTFCHDYYQCNDGAYSEGTCGANQYFNLVSGECQTAVPNGCQDPRCINVQNGFYLINTVCKSYYQCTDGFYTGFSCPNNGYFNLAIGQCQTAVPTGCQDPRCNNVANGFYLINNFCKSYYQCNNGFYTGFDCGANEYYNLAQGSCQSSVPVGCQDPKCIGQPNGFYLVNTLCRNYFQCADGIYTLSQCGNNQYFNLGTSQCQTTVPNGCQDPRCIGFNDGFYLVNNVCRNYYQCNGGFYTGFSCPNNGYFNLAAGSCQSSVPTGCQDPRCTGQTNGFYLINNLCKDYYRCQDGFYTGASCSGTNGQIYFNTAIGQCQSDLPTGCQDPRCVSRSNGLYLVNNFCKDYFRCQDGFYTGLNCANGYLNIATGTCQADVPNGCRDPRCTGKNNGFYLVNTVCTSYYQCTDGFYTSFSCNNGYFNLVTNQCQQAVPNGCQDPRCIGQTNGLYLVNNLCKDYYRCADGFYTALQCANTQQYFNLQQGVCQDAVPAGCQDPRCIGQNDGFYLVNNLCTSYYRCTGGIYEGLSCPSGSYFNLVQGSCQTALPSGCQDPRCIGRANAFYLVNNLCTAYYQCNDGFYTGFQCTAPNSYYNLAENKCQAAVPSGCQDPRCIGKNNGFYLLNNLCKEYYQCNDGFHTTFSCPSGQYYHINSNACLTALPSTCQDPRCIGKNDGFYLVDNLCTNYFQCTNGLYKGFACPNNGYYNTVNGQCQTGVPNGCQDPRCIGQSDGFYLVNNFCTAYFQCNQGLYTGFNCGTGQYYNINNRACQSTVPAGCQDPRCIGKNNGFYLVNNVCKDYYQCNDGIYTSFSCSTGTYYHLTSNQCLSALPNNCQDPRCIGQADGFYLVNNLCTSYYQCTTGFYQGFSCPNSGYYNLASGSCQSAVPSGCQDPRCIGRNDGFYTVNNLCTSYFQCTGGFHTGFNCGTGQYYNVATKACQSTVPSGCQDPQCSGRANGFYLVNNLCAAYYQCNDGFYTAFSCPSGQLYNLATGQCGTTVPTGCQDPLCSSKANGFYLVNNLCTSYYQCTDGIKADFACQSGQYFNTGINQCQSNVPTGCQDPRCIGRSTGFYLVNNLCQAYYRCEDGFHTGFTCTNGYYNINTLQCQTAVPSGCQDPACAGRSDGLYLRNNLCTQYFRCAGGFYTLLNCPANQFFHTDTGSCQTALPSGCQDPRCTGQADGFYLVNNLCTAYYQCASGFYTAFSCPANSYFSTVTGTCVTNLPSGCQDPRCQGLSNGNYRITTDTQCRTYYICNNGFYTGATCPSGTYFHSDTQSCQTALPTGCADPRCIGVADGRYLLNDLCTSYFTCSAGQYTLLNCNQGTYFNDATKQCQSVVPSGCQDPQCIGRNNGFYLVNTLCTSYFQCTAGFKTDFNCQQGTYYNTATGQCQSAIPSGCQDPICIGRVDGFYVANNLCQSYYNCQSGIATTLSCQSGTYFNVATGQCQTSTPSGCQDSFCQTQANGNYPVDTVCRSYYTCNGGFKTINVCPNNGYYNAASRVCETNVPAGCIHPDCQDANQANGFRTNGNYLIDQTCAGYYSCSNGFKTIAQCPTGLLFNQVIGACQSGVPTGCLNPQCANKADGNYLVNNLCTSYYNCASGVYTLRTCTTGYFNEATGACQNAVPSGCQSPLCVGRNDGLYLANNLCTTYYRCTSGAAEQLACPTTPIQQYFTVSVINGVNTGSCSTTLPNNCQDPICSSRANGFYISDGDVCKQYFRCTDGFKFPGTCQDGSFFNTATGQCQSTPPTGCNPASACSGQPDGTYKVQNDLNCRTYFTCQSGIYQFFTCPDTTPYFGAQGCTVNPPSGCTAIPTVVQNNCAGQADGYYTVNLFCQGYYQCVNQQVPSILSCGNQYFDTNINQCVSSAPSGCYNPQCIDANFNLLNNFQVTDSQCTGGFQCSSGFKTNIVSCDLNTYYNVNLQKTNKAEACSSTRPNTCQAQTVNLCTGKSNGYYLADEIPGTANPTQALCRLYYSCVAEQAPVIQECNNLAVPYFNTGTNQCQSTPNTGCKDMRCYTITTDVSNNQRQIIYNNNRGVIDNTCQQGYSCNAAANGDITFITCNNDVNGQRTFYNSATGTCVSLANKPASCVAPPTPASDCTGKADFDRVPHATDASKFHVCQNGQSSEIKTCPTATIFPSQAPNGKWFSPYFKTCINTTTGNPPVHTPTGTSDMCQEIATYIAFGFSGTRLPDVTDCKKWIQCTDQQFVPQSVGSCVSQPYNPDKQFCEFTHNCFFPSP